MSHLKRRPAAIVVLKSKAELVRQLAAEHGFSYKEAPVLEREDAIRFYFEAMDNTKTRKLVSLIPRDAYAYRVVGVDNLGNNKDSG